MSNVWKLHFSSLALAAALAIIGGCVAGDPGSDDGAPPATAEAVQDSVVGSTMYLSSRVYPSRDLVPGTSVDTVASTPGGPVHLVAPVYTGYALLFWHVPRTLTTSSTVDFTVPDAQSFYATAWYVATGCQGCPPPAPAVTTVAFSNDRDEVIAATPIASVNPASAWAGSPSTVVSTAGSAPVAITAQPLLDGSGEFVSWLSLSGIAASGRTLTEPSLASDTALALFAIPSPDPCAALRTTRDNLDPGDFSTPDAYRRALASLNAQLHACEKAHGEALD